MIKTIATEAKSLSQIAIEGLQEKKGQEIVRMDLTEVPGAVTDYFVICTGTSDRHVQALANSVEAIIQEDAGEKPHNKEGVQQGEWVLLDYVNVVVHIFQREKRTFYDIEGLWGDAEFENFE